MDFKAWTREHQGLWEFIKFNVLSNISTVTRFVVTWVGTWLFVNTMALTTPFSFLIFNYTSEGSHGLGGASSRSFWPRCSPRWSTSSCR